MKKMLIFIFAFTLITPLQAKNIRLLKSFITNTNNASRAHPIGTSVKQGRKIFFYYKIGPLRVRKGKGAPYRTKLIIRKGNRVLKDFGWQRANAVKPHQRRQNRTYGWYHNARWNIKLSRKLAPGRYNALIYHYDQNAEENIAIRYTFRIIGESASRGKHRSSTSGEIINTISDIIKEDTSKNSKTNINMGLYRAAKSGNTRKARYYLDKGANANFKDRYGQSLIWLASRFGHTGVVRLLLSAGANPNVIKGRSLAATSPLSVAARYGHINTVKALLAGGARSNLDLHRGRTAIASTSRQNYKGPSHRRLAVRNILLSLHKKSAAKGRWVFVKTSVKKRVKRWCRVNRSGSSIVTKCEWYRGSPRHKYRHEKWTWNRPRKQYRPGSVIKMDARGKLAGIKGKPNQTIPGVFKCSVEYSARPSYHGGRDVLGQTTLKQPYRWKRYPKGTIKAKPGGKVYVNNNTAVSYYNYMTINAAWSGPGSYYMVNYLYKWQQK